MLTWLAQTIHRGGGLPGEAESNPYTVFIYAGLIAAAAILMGIVSLAIRKRMLTPDEPDAGGGMGFTLSDLREMHRRGELTDEEFDQAKRRLIANARAELREDEETDAELDGVIHLDGEPKAGNDADADDELGPDDDALDGPHR